MHNVKWICHSTGNDAMTEEINTYIATNSLLDMERVPVVETVPNEDDEEELNHGTPASECAIM